MKDVLYLAWRYLRYNRGKTGVLVGSIALILFLPASLRVVVERAAGYLTDRAEQTPLVVGAQGSPVDLTLASLYFREPSTPPIPFQEVEELNGSGLATAIPLHLRFSARGHRIVGTIPEYLVFRALELEEGRGFALLGEAVLGARAAESLGLGVGDPLVSTPAGAFDIAGSFPLQMNVVGVLAPDQSPDDDAIFVDLKTAWVIAGIGHGHDDASQLDDGEGQIEVREEGSVTMGAAVLPYTEITPANLASFHFHGDPAAYPVDAAIVVPNDTRSGIILQGRYTDGAAPVQIVAPRQVVDGLVETMFSVRAAALLVSAGLALATIATCTLVFALSIRLRYPEMEAMRKIGAPQSRIWAVLSVEIVAIVGAAILIATFMTLIVSRFGTIVLRLIGV